MKKILLLFSFLLILVVTSCSSGDEPDGKKDYYVKYELSASYPGRVGVPTNIVINTDTGKKELTVGYTWEATYGPVSKGFEALLEVPKQDYTQYRSNCTIRISVSKNTEPFSVKAEQSAKRQSMKISYIIE